MSETAAAAGRGRSKAASAPVARSPIAPGEPVKQVAGWSVSAGPGRKGRVAADAAATTLADLTPLAKVRVRATPGERVAGVLGCAFKSSRRDGEGRLVLGTGPDEWLVLSPAGTAAEAAAALESSLASGEAEELVSVVDVTHGGFLVRVAGEGSRRLLEKLCALDLSERSMPDGSVARTSVARIVCDVARDDRDGACSFLLHGDRSAGQYFFDALLDAGREVSAGVSAYPDKEL